MVWRNLQRKKRKRKNEKKGNKNQKNEAHKIYTRTEQSLCNALPNVSRERKLEINIKRSRFNAPTQLGLIYAVTFLPRSVTISLIVEVKPYVVHNLNIEPYLS